MISLPAWLATAADQASSGPAAASAPAVDPETLGWCPAWAKERAASWLEPFTGRFGLPEPYPHWGKPIGLGTAGLDFWQANHFIVCRPETESYLYTDYSPTVVQYTPGTLPEFEAFAERFTAGLQRPRDQAVALLTKALPRVLMHPGMPPLGPQCRTDRGLSDIGLLESGTGFCNEQARVFVRLCQVKRIPARMIFLFYSDKTSGHVVAEFYADGHWCMADSSWFCVFPDETGRLMSAAECHRDAGRELAGQAYFKRVQEVLAYSDERLVGRRFPNLQGPERATQIGESADELRQALRKRNADMLEAKLWAFGVLNYPLPPR